jgi:hypothetical protein
MSDGRDDLPGGRLRNPGGTRGGMGEFLLGVVMVLAGGYLFLNNVVVTTSGGMWASFGFGGGTPFGLTLLPLLLGIGLLFFDGKSVLGWVLTLGAALAIVVGIITSLSVHWRPSSLYVTLGIFVLLAGGLGLLARALRDHG